MKRSRLHSDPFHAKKGEPLTALSSQKRRLHFGVSRTPRLRVGGKRSKICNNKKISPGKYLYNHHRALTNTAQVDFTTRFLSLMTCRNRKNANNQTNLFDPIIGLADTLEKQNRILWLQFGVKAVTAIYTAIYDTV